MDTKHNVKHSAATDPSKRRALGKGLESLLSSRGPLGTTDAAKPAASLAWDTPPSASAASPVSDAGTAREIPVDQINPSPYQTRMRVDEQKLEELARSIAAHGVVQPAIVRPLPDGRFELIAGERRWMASKKAGKTTLPAIVRHVSDEQAMEMTIVENLQRADLNPMEQARAFDRLGREFKITQEQMALRTGKDRATIGNFLRLLKLPLDVQNQVESGDLSFGHAKLLLAMDSPDAIVKMAARITSLAMSVRQTETYIQGVLNPERRVVDKKEPEPMDANVRAVQEHLQRELGLKVRIEDRKGKGRVVIEYSRLEDFDSIMHVLGGIP